jgi:hypothetical protein
LNVVGVILNHATEEHFDPGFVLSNAEQIERFGSTKILGVCHHGAGSVVPVGGAGLAGSDWFSLFGCAE